MGFRLILPAGAQICAIASVAGCIAITGGCANGGAQIATGDSTAAQSSGLSHRQKSQLARANKEDIPADMGTSLLEPPEPAPEPVKRLSIDVPIGAIAAKPDGRAVLDKDLPGLCERPEYPTFKSMSLKALANLSSGRISAAKLTQVQADLAKLNSARNQ